MAVRGKRRRAGERGRVAAGGDGEREGGGEGCEERGSWSLGMDSTVVIVCKNLK